MHKITLVAAGAAILTAAGVMPADAVTCTSGSPCNTSPTTFTVTAGNLSITVPDSATLTGGHPGDTVTSPRTGPNSFGSVSVNDAQGGTAGWTAQVLASNFDGGVSVPTIPPSALTYDPGTVTSTGSGDFPTTTQTLSSAYQTVVQHTNASGGSTASWQPAITIAIPITASAVTYTGTVTHQVT